MKRGLTAPLGSRPPPAAELRRSRWPVFFCALVLLWCVWWYCRGESQGLLYLASGLSALAVARSRALPSTTRWIIWSGVVVLIACLAANVTRLVPPENALEETRGIDRVITVVFSAGLTALFFRPSIDSVTLAAVSGLPMAMVVLARREDVAGAAKGLEEVIVWGSVALMIAADLAQRLTRRRNAEEPVTPGVREVGWRLFALAAVAALAFGLRLPLEWTARGVQKLLFGWVMNPEHTLKRKGGDLWLSLPTPSDFGQRMRVVMLVGAGGVPGYLRERVFSRYQGGRWAATKPEETLKEESFDSSVQRKGAYALVPVPAPPTSFVWRVEVLAPALMSGFCLPGNAVALTCDGPPPLGDASGAVAAKELLPERYDLTVVPSSLLYSAYPLPDGRSNPAFLEVPAPLAGAVSNWVSACAGLAEAPSLPAAIRRVEDYFATNFTYRLGVRMKSAPDPLVDFMKRKEGSCTLFASAAALMFRGCGVPARVIDGFACSGWNPWLKRWVVRERDGHAWVEVWDRGSGRWLVADPTPPDGHSGLFNKPGKIRLALDLLGAGWKRLVGYLKKANFLEVIADVGAMLFLFLWQVVLSLPGLVVLAGFGVVWWLRRRLSRRKLTPAERLRAELMQAMAGLERRTVAPHLRRRHFESWSLWLRRIGPELPRERLDLLRERLESYQALRYSATLDEAAVHEWCAQTRSVKPRAPQRKGV